MASVESTTIEQAEVLATDDAVAASDQSPPERRRFSVDEYYMMAEAGILKPDERVELIDGDIIAMCPMGSRHSGSINRLNSLLIKTFSLRANVSVQCPVRLDHRTEPEPDFALLKPRDDYYEDAHPGPSDVFVLIEVMDASEKYDRKKKLRLYARFGIPEVWLIDLKGEFVEIHRRPKGKIYKENQIMSRGERFAPEAFPDAVLEVDAILGAT